MELLNDKSIDDGIIYNNSDDFESDLTSKLMDRWNIGSTKEQEQVYNMESFCEEQIAEIWKKSEISSSPALLHLKNLGYGSKKFVSQPIKSYHTRVISEEYVFENNETTGNKDKPYLLLYIQLGAPTSKLRGFDISGTPNLNTRPNKKARLLESQRQYCLCAFGLDKTVCNYLGKWNQDDIDILKLLRDAWHDPMELASGDK
ncbi:13582_t:CDS:2 [Ambispora gerdemannii]|uniref:13582_t:CDS:1 n=1 Tax=Ambispora gerdemannii TaxID=144530 RepID=A0A9N9F5Y2_9GLOM|nr:13582_t:CDS:2 [Ambispora gerdemannii]